MPSSRSNSGSPKSKSLNKSSLLQVSMEIKHKIVLLLNDDRLTKHKDVTGKIEDMYNVANVVTNMIQKINDNSSSSSSNSAKSIVYNILESRTYNRLPIIHDYDLGKDDFEKSAEKVFKKLIKKNMVQVGDVLCPDDGYRGDGVFIVSQDGMLEYPIQMNNGEYGYPAWMIEIGIKHGYTYEAMKKAYMGTSSFIVLPESMQKKLKLNKDGRFISYDIWNTEEEVQQTLDKKEGFLYLKINMPDYEDVFLAETSSSKSASPKPASPKPKSPKKK